MPPQPSIEEARQQMHSLLDDAFALVSPSSQGSVSPSHLLLIRPSFCLSGSLVCSSFTSPLLPPHRDSQSWECLPHPSRVCYRGQSLGNQSVSQSLGNQEKPVVATAEQRVMSLCCVSVCVVSCRQGLSSAGFVSSGEQLHEAVYSSRGQYEEPPSSSRPRPVGGSTGGLLWPRLCALHERLL